LKKGSDFIQETQPYGKISVFRKIWSDAKRRVWSFRQNSPRVFEIQKKRAFGEAGVP
jgi:streptogramin lyase